MPPEILFVLLLCFFIGASLGSFLNVLIDRLPRDESFFKSRSKCESCHKKLLPQDLIPVISYVLLAGKCRYCHARIPKRILFVEVLSGAIALFIFFYAAGASLSVFFALFLYVIVLCFLGIFLVDLKDGIIPDEFNIAIAILTIVLLLLGKANLYEHALVALVSFSMFLALYVFTHGRGMGLGDVKLAGVIGLFLGFPNIIVGMYVAFLTAMFISIILILVGKKKLRGSTIAFGPFLSVGAVVGYFLGTRILSLFL